MGMDLLYHSLEKVGDYALSATDVTAFPAGAPVGMNPTDGGVQRATAENNVFGLAKTARSLMASTGPSVGGTTYGSATVLTGVCIVELTDNSAVLADDGSPLQEAINTYNNTHKLYFLVATKNWGRTQPGAQVPFGAVLVASADSNEGGVVAYFAFTPRT